MATTRIPVFDFSEQTLKLKEGSAEGWKSLRERVVEACEEYGCFLVAYDRVPMNLYDEFFKTTQSLFDLPEETKAKNTNSTGYVANENDSPLLQSLGIDNMPQLDGIKAFTDIMWPQGNPDACRAIHSMAAKMHDLYKLVIRMIFQGLGVEQYLASHLETSEASLRLNQYEPPKSPDSVIALGMGAHFDYTVLSILGQNEVHGVKVLSRGGDWIQVELPSKGTFLVLVGEMLEVMSNGRIQASNHKVEIAGDRARHSFGLFTGLKERTMVEVFNELVDKEHPLRYRPFDYGDYMKYYMNTGYINSVKVYAGI